MRALIGLAVAIPIALVVSASSETPLWTLVCSAPLIVGLAWTLFLQEQYDNFRK